MLLLRWLCYFTFDSVLILNFGQMLCLISYLNSLSWCIVLKLTCCPNLVIQEHQDIVRKLVELVGITSIMEVGCWSPLFVASGTWNFSFCIRSSLTINNIIKLLVTISCHPIYSWDTVVHDNPFTHQAGFNTVDWCGWTYVYKLFGGNAVDSRDWCSGDDCRQVQLFGKWF